MGNPMLIALILKDSGDFRKSHVTESLYPEGCKLYPNVRGVRLMRNCPAYVCEERQGGARTRSRPRSLAGPAQRGY